MKTRIKVSREVSKWIKTLSENMVEYIGEMLNYRVSQKEFDWEDVNLLTIEDIKDLITFYAEVETFDDVEEKAKDFCWKYGFYGYRLQSKF